MASVHGTTSVRESSSVAKRYARHAGWLALCTAVALSSSEAYAGECTLRTPECHLENGKKLLASDPRRAAEELLASFQLDERTDTLELYATALQADRKYAHALETWQRIIVFRESELEAAKSDTKSSSSRKRAAARTAVNRAQTQLELAAQAIIELWPNVGRARVRVPAGQQIAVTRDGVEVDVSRDVLVNAGRDELVFTRKGGSPQRVVVEVAAGSSVKVDAPEPAAEPPPSKPQKMEKIEKPRPRSEEPKPVAKPEAPKAAPKAEPKAEPKPAPKLELEEKEEPAKQPEMPLSTVKYVEEPRSRTMSRVGLGLVAGAVVAGGIAGGLGYLADRDYDRSLEIGCSADGQCPVGPAADLAERSNDRARLAQISAIGGGAMLATGVVMWIVGRGKTRRVATDVAVRVEPSSVAVAWRF
jgi:hypothetical protein